MSDRLVAEATTSKRTTNTWDEFPCHDGIRTRYPSNRTAADPRLRPHGHRDRPEGHYNVQDQLPAVHILSLLNPMLLAVYFFMVKVNTLSMGFLKCSCTLILLQSHVDGLLCMWQWTFGVHKMRWISWLPEILLVTQEGLWSMQLISFLLG
jgi:hypothetical protein